MNACKREVAGNVRGVGGGQGFSDGIFSVGLAFRGLERIIDASELDTMPLDLAVAARSVYDVLEAPDA